MVVTQYKSSSIVTLRRKPFFMVMRVIKIKISVHGSDVMILVTYGDHAVRPVAHGYDTPKVVTHSDGN